jgi:ribose 5-phosphate isomerase RpiB
MSAFPEPFIILDQKSTTILLDVYTGVIEIVKANAVSVVLVLCKLDVGISFALTI